MITTIRNKFSHPEQILASLFLGLQLGIAKAISTGCDTLFDASNANTGLSDITAAIQHWWFIPFLVFLILWGVSKEDRPKAVFKGCTFGVLVVLIVSFVIGDQSQSGFIYDTIEKISGWF